MSSILINISRLNLCRAIWHKLHSKYSDAECYAAFVATMNAKAQEWGLKNTKWINPSGLGENGVYSQSTANDLSAMALCAFGVKECKSHDSQGYELSIKKPYLIPGHRSKKKMVYSTTTIETIGDNYPIIGSKTGNGDGYQTLVMVCDIKGIKVAGAIMNAEDEQGRFEAMDELMRIGYKILHEQVDAKKMKVTKAMNASLCVMDKKGKTNHIFTQNADEVSAPMSTTKVMTWAIARQYISDWQKMEYIIPFDTKETGNDILYDWDKLTIEDMKQAMMRHSSNVVANAIARIVGAMILEKKAMMEIAPIVIFSYDRPKHLQQTLDALAKNELADMSDLFIFCDGAKESAPAEQLARIKENRKVAHAASGFKSVTVVERPKNIGLKANIVGAVTEIVDKYGRIITLEDDIVTSRGFLRFMNEALETYKDDEQVMHISGYMWPHRWPLPETFFYEVPYPGGGWATWKRAWQYYDDDAAKLYHKWENRWDEFNKFGGDYLSKQLVANYEGRMNTWFIKWHAVLLERGALTLYPGNSLTNNIGFDSLATNCYASHKFDVVPVNSISVKRKPIKECWLAAHEIYAFYQGRWYNRRRRNAMLSKIKNIFCFWT